MPLPFLIAPEVIAGMTAVPSSLAATSAALGASGIGAGSAAGLAGTAAALGSAAAAPALVAPTLGGTAAGAGAGAAGATGSEIAKDIGLNALGAGLSTASQGVMASNPKPREGKISYPSVGISSIQSSPISGPLFAGRSPIGDIPRSSLAMSLLQRGGYQ